MKVIEKMFKLVVRPPRINLAGKGGFWRQIGMIIIGTSISLVLTVTVTKLLDSHQRAKDRHLSAMMVLSNIESFSRRLEEHAEIIAPQDSIATWLFSKSFDELELMPENELRGLIEQAIPNLFLTYDKSAENIFSNNIETWKNMGNVHFIDQVGQCFSAMHSIEEYWNKRITKINEVVLDINENPSNYEGSTLPMKKIRSEKVRSGLKSIHYLRGWLSYTAATMRYHNLNNMASINITEQEVIDFTDYREQEIENPNKVPDISDYQSASLNPDSLTTMRSFNARLEQLTRENMGKSSLQE